jgi:hypothetical protein
MCLILGTLTAILRGRFLLVHLENPTDGEILEMFVHDFESEEFVISCVADDVGPGNALWEGHFPPSVWAEAEARWASWDDR